MRCGLALLACAVALCGCRGDVQGTRVNLLGAARVLRAYSSARAATPPREVFQLSPQRLNDLGVMLERRGMLAQAEQHYRRAVESKPDFARAWVNLGNVARRQGRDDEALEHYRRAMKEDSALFEAVNNYADLCADRGNGVGEALRLLEPALAKHPQDENVGLDTLGRLLMRQGRYRDAAAAFRRASDITDPREKELLAQILTHLAAAYRAAGDARAAYSAELRAGAASLL